MNVSLATAIQERFVTAFGFHELRQAIGAGLPGASREM